MGGDGDVFTQQQQQSRRMQLLGHRVPTRHTTRHTNPPGLSCLRRCATHHS